MRRAAKFLFCCLYTFEISEQNRDRGSSLMGLLSSIYLQEASVGWPLAR